MSPTLDEGDLVAWIPINIEDVKIGDVIVFKSYIHWPDEKIVVHRVTDIKTNSKGNILLETKGDKNPWTDQAGPHIPEAHIREENLLGKALSVGQQPLKIPFIGNLGLWINEGLTLISQPTSTKGSVSYIGIFAPLTISVIVLVVLIFLLPEKAKTVKEKIRLYIFGRRPLNLKRTIITLLIAYVVFLTVIHAFAYDSTTASVGVDDKSPVSNLNFGVLQPGKESFQKDFPLINPGIMPVKGIIFGNGEMKDFIPSQTFELERGEIKSTYIRAVIPNGTAKGSYLGGVMLYSSPFWLMFPDDFIHSLLNWNAETTVFVLDLLSAIILTSITILLFVSITFIQDKLTILAVDRSWRYPSTIIIKRRTAKKAVTIKNKIKHALEKDIGWIGKIDFTENKIEKTKLSKLGKPIIAALVVIPIIFFLEDKIVAMFIAALTAGLLAYFISCKLRNKIILTVLITMTLAIIHMTFQTNLIIISKQQTYLEVITLATGSIGIYMLILGLLLIPFALLSWFITRLMRNLKERRDPLLSLEGSCDL